MASTHNPPLSYEASATTCHPSVSSSLPPEVVACLKNSRFLHLATCDASSTPHISLMSYTYLPRGSPFRAQQYPTIIMTTNPSSRKTTNLLANPRVSLLVHDWVSHRPPTLANPDQTSTGPTEREGSPPPAATRSSLASLLLSLNTSALSSISTTIMGEARVVERGAEEERWCKERHRENNTFASDEAGLQPQQQEPQQQDEDDDEDVRVVAVQVKEGRIADWKGGVRDWVVSSPDEDAGQQQQGSSSSNTLPNGVLES